MKVRVSDYIGKKVVYRSDDGEKFSSEFGVIVNAWYDDNMEMIDCYVALYEHGKKLGKKDYRPSILHYFLESLEIIE